MGSLAGLEWFVDSAGSAMSVYSGGSARRCQYSVCSAICYSPVPDGTVACLCREKRTWKSDSALSRNVLGSGLAVFAGFSELRELFTLAPGVGVWDVCGAPRGFSGSRAPAPFAVGICEPGPADDEISLVAGGSALGGCCLFFLPKRNDMATGVRWLRRQR